MTGHVDMTQCQRCQTTLVADGILTGQRIRCANCSHQFRFGEEEKTSTDRLAWRSFWLGLSSLILLFFTGIPAIYFGVRSLLRMRFTQPRPRDRFAALAGTAMGGCFGLAGGFIVFFSAAVIAATLYTMERAKGPEDVRQLYGQIFQNEMPTDLVAQGGLGVLRSQYFFEFCVRQNDEYPTMEIHLLHNKSAFQQTSAQMLSIFRSNHKGYPLRLKERNHEQLNWRFVDQDIDIMKIVFEIGMVEIDSNGKAANNPPTNSPASLALDNQPDSANTVLQYYGICKSSNTITGMSVLVKQPHPVYTEEKIRELFASMRLKGD